MLLELPLVLPAQRPASPEIAESPTLTIHGAPTPGPSACAGAAPVATVAPTNPNNIAPTASLRPINAPRSATPPAASAASHARRFCSSTPLAEHLCRRVRGSGRQRGEARAQFALGRPAETEPEVTVV